MVTMGDGATTSMLIHDTGGRTATTSRSDVELMRDAYTGELSEFALAVQQGRRSAVTGDDAFAAFAVAEAAIESARTGARAAVAVRP
jgi:myo-inositol 2-dehydrogenase/D-chiro-inositol 1-dehydrogenase